MQTKSLIQAQANIIKITELKIGDVIKLVNEEYSTPKIEYAIVLDLLNSGSKTFIHLLQYEKSYSDNFKLNSKLYNGSEDLQIFPAKVEDVKDYLSGTVRMIEEDIKEKEKELDEKKQALEKAKDFMSGEMSKKLTEASYEEVKSTKQLKA